MSIQKGITAQTAWRLRESGLLLSGNGRYADPRVQYIAGRQQELMQEYDNLDRELKQLAQEEENGQST